MEATLLLRNPHTCAKKLTFLFTIRNNTHLISFHTNMTRFLKRTARCPPLVFCSHSPSSPNNNGPKEEGGKYLERKQQQQQQQRGGGTGICTALAVACMVGVLMCSKRGMMQHALAWRKLAVSPVQTHQLEQSLPLLLHVFERSKSLPVSKRWVFKRLDERFSTSKDHKYKEYSKVIQKSGGHQVLNSLNDLWEKEVGSEHKYELGLLLTEVHIQQGDYDAAIKVCKQLERIGPPSDPRLPLYMVAINLMLTMEGIRNFAEKSTLNPEAAEKTLESMQAAEKYWDKFKNIYGNFGTPPMETP